VIVKKESQLFLIPLDSIEVKLSQLGEIHRVGKVAAFFKVEVHRLSELIVLIVGCENNVYV